MVLYLIANGINSACLYHKDSLEILKQFLVQKNINAVLLQSHLFRMHCSTVLII